MDPSAAPGGLGGRDTGAALFPREGVGRVQGTNLNGMETIHLKVSDYLTDTEEGILKAEPTTVWSMLWSFGSGCAQPPAGLSLFPHWK